MKKSNLFLVYTEYHLMYAISIIVQKYNTNDYQNTVLISNLKGTRRTPSKIGVINLPAKFIILEGDERSDKILAKDIELIKSLINIKYNSFISFLDNTPYFYYLHYHLYKKGTKIILGADGSKPYRSVEGFTFPSQFKNTLQLYFHLFRREMLVPYLLVTSDKIYAKSKLIDKLWVPFCNDLKTNREYVAESIELIPNYKVLKSIFDVFKVSTEIRNLVYKYSILYLNSIFPNQNGYALEQETIRLIRKSNPKNKIYIKCHPQTPQSQREAFLEIEGVELLEIKLPAEIIISLFNDSAIVSFWSASLLTNNKNCKFYWLINFCEKYLGYKLIDLPIYPEHITRLECKSELNFNLF